jgi:hypothetical protein
MALEIYLKFKNQWYFSSPFAARHGHCSSGHPSAVPRSHAPYLHIIISEAAEYILLKNQLKIFIDSEIQPKNIERSILS